MENGLAITISNKVYEIGTTVQIAGSTYEVYNTMPGLKLIGFAKLAKNGKRMSTAPMSLTEEQIEKFMKLGVIA